MTAGSGPSHVVRRAASTFLQALVEALETASVYDRQDQATPAAVLWPDRERRWEPLVARLRERLPVVSLAPYAPEQQSGPAYWLRCLICEAVIRGAQEYEWTAFEAFVATSFRVHEFLPSDGEFVSRSRALEGMAAKGL